VTSAGPLRLAGAGIGIVGVSFGMARYGYGLLLPEIRGEYRLGPGTLGAVASAGYVAYLAATTAAGALAGRAGPRRTAVGSGLLAAAGMALAALTRSPAGLLAGVLAGGAGAGLAFPPFSDAARDLAPRTRDRVLAAINCGTGYGVVLAAPIAIAAGADWRAAWLACAALALAAAAWAARVLPRGPAAASAANPLRALRDRRAAPLLAGGLLVGLGSSAFWTFAVERLDAAGALSSDASRAFLGVVGAAGILATLTGGLVHRLGARRAFRACVTTEATGIALLAIAPRSLAAALIGAVLFGAAYNAVVAIQSLWSTRLFAGRPSLGLAAAMAANGLGLLAGPLVAGLLAAPLGLGAVLGLGAAVVLAAGRFAPAGSRLLI
jgi:predicted MFS family arabinose efflux permease